jgi:hypothetical protein
MLGLGIVMLAVAGTSLDLLVPYQRQVRIRQMRCRARSAATPIAASGLAIGKGEGECNLRRLKVPFFFSRHWISEALITNVGGQ